MKKRYIVGSTYYFDKEEFPDFMPSDIDILLVESNPNGYSDIANFGIKKNGENFCYFLFKERSKEEWLAYFQNKLSIHWLLNKEFAKDIGVTINDLKALENQFRQTDGKHLYEQYIYECYQENHNFKLTDKQREHAYKLYKEERQ